MKFLLVSFTLVGLLGACATAPVVKPVAVDATGELLPRDAAWEQARDNRLAAFKQATGDSLIVRFVAVSPSEREDKVPGAYMKALATQLGVAKRGALVVHFSDEDDWRIWFGDESLATFVGQAGTAKELTDSGSAHDAKDAFLAAAHSRAQSNVAEKQASTFNTPVASITAVRAEADTLIDGLIERLSPATARVAPLVPK